MIFLAVVVHGLMSSAIQVAPHQSESAYAHTLAGHEHVANEEFDRGLDYYRAAVRLEPRRYNAWYGPFLTPEVCPPDQKDKEFHYDACGINRPFKGMHD